MTIYNLFLFYYVRIILLIVVLVKLRISLLIEIGNLLTSTLHNSSKLGCYNGDQAEMRIIENPITIAIELSEACIMDTRQHACLYTYTYIFILIILVKCIG